MGGNVLRNEASNETGWKHDALVALDRWLRDLPNTSGLISHALEATDSASRSSSASSSSSLLCRVLDLRAQPRDRARRLVLLAKDKRRVVRDTWELIDLKLGAFVRGQLILIVVIATVLSLSFWAIGLPYWILVGAFAGLVEIVPVVGPLSAALAVGVGLTESWHLALAAGLIVLAVRLTEDYLVIPKVLGDAVGLSPLLVLVSVTATAILFGGFAVLLAIPLAAVTRDARHRHRPREGSGGGEVPAVLFTAQDAET